MHCFRHEGFEPDFVCLGKGLGGGLPISALVGPSAIMDHATSFSMQTLHGNPTCTAAARAVLQTINEERLVSHSAAVGDLLLAELRNLMARHHCISDVRGRGLAIGIEVIDPTGAPSKALAAKIVYRAFELGAVIYYVGLNSNVLELTPPLILSRAEAAEAVAVVYEAITDVVTGKVSDHAIADFIGW
jgi:4-aminobutyrate aminotransferase